jgi:hypothetical protein
MSPMALQEDKKCSVVVGPRISINQDTEPQNQDGTAVQVHFYTVAIVYLSHEQTKMGLDVFC